VTAGLERRPRGPVYQVEVAGNLEGALRRLEKNLAAGGLFRELREHEHFIPRGARRRRKQKRARDRAARALARRDA